MPKRAATCRLVAVAVSFVVVGCGIPDQSRWERGEQVDSDVSDPAASAVAVAVVEVGPVVEAVEATGRVLVVDPVVVVADRTGRVERRTTAVGDAIAAGDAVVEFSDTPDPVDELRIDILEIEREIASLDGLDEEVARLDVAIDEAAAAARGNTSDITTANAPVDGVISEFFVRVFDVVRAGDELFAVGDPANRAVVLAIPLAEFEDGAELPDVGSQVSLVDPRSALGEPVAAMVTSSEAIITDDRPTGDEASEAAPGATTRPEQRVVIALDPSSPFDVGDDITVVFESASATTSLRLAVEAVRGTGDTAYVIVDDGSGWRRVDVRIGARTDRFVQIADAVPSLEDGDRVVLP